MSKNPFFTKTKQFFAEIAKELGMEAFGQVLTFKQALELGVPIAKGIIRDVDEFQEANPLAGAFVVILASVTAVIYGTTLAVAGGAVLNVSTCAALTALLRSDSELAQLSLLASSLGLTALYIGGFIVVCGLILVVRSIFRFVRWIGGKIGALFNRRKPAISFSAALPAMAT